MLRTNSKSGVRPTNHYAYYAQLLKTLCIGSAIGLMIGAAVARKLGAPTETKIKAELALGLRFFCTVILPALFVAALIEAYVTSALITH
ncbi:MAG: stage II sporulation protein M [Deltaproteobacteria bacterium]|nr:stage II sporulation protein M [Deltaproteobacteria bacterium]